MKVKTLGTVCIGPNLTKREIKSLQKTLESGKFKKEFSVARILAGETRFKILFILTKEHELCVCDLSEALDTTVSAVSHQLKILRDAEIVGMRRSKQSIIYFLKDKKVKEYFQSI